MIGDSGSWRMENGESGAMRLMQGEKEKETCEKYLTSWTSTRNPKWIGYFLSPWVGAGCAMVRTTVM